MALRDLETVAKIPPIAAWHSQSPPKVGILGGSFNPVHVGHLLIAETALDQFALDQVIWVPTYRPPHKSTGLLDYSHRVVMVKQAIADHPNFSVSNAEIQDTEIQSEERSYADSTLATLELQHPNSCWYWLIGIDSFQSLPSWRNSLELATRCIWLVAPRSSDSTQHLCQEVAATMATSSVQLDWRILLMPQIEISSSLIRQYCQQGRSLRYLVPEAVRQYILDHKLYQ